MNVASPSSPNSISVFFFDGVEGAFFFDDFMHARYERPQQQREVFVHCRLLRRESREPRRLLGSDPLDFLVLFAEQVYAQLAFAVENFALLFAQAEACLVGLDVALDSVLAASVVHYYW